MRHVTENSTLPVFRNNMKILFPFSLDRFPLLIAGGTNKMEEKFAFSSNVYHY